MILPANSTKYSRSKIIPIVHIFFQSIRKKKGLFSNSFYEASIALISEPDKDSTRKEIYRPVLFMTLDANILNILLSN